MLKRRRRRKGNNVKILTPAKCTEKTRGNNVKSWLKVEIEKLKKHDKKEIERIHFLFSPNFAPAAAPVILDFWLN